MANHEFGIMQNQPMNKERFDEYEPNKYDCIVVDDNFIEPILIDLQKPCNYVFCKLSQKTEVTAA